MQDGLPEPKTASLAVLSAFMTVDVRYDLPAEHRLRAVR
jgi:hypothetical protein